MPNYWIIYLNIAPTSNVKGIADEISLHVPIEGAIQQIPRRIAKDEAKAVIDVKCQLELRCNRVVQSHLSLESEFEREQENMAQKVDVFQD